MNAVEVKKKPSLKKILLAVVGVIVALLVVAFAVIYGVWHNEISTVTSIEMLRDRNDEHLDGAVYSMHVKGGFYLDDFIAQGGASNDNELIQFITDNITRGVVDIQMTAPEIGCSAFTSVTPGVRPPVRPQLRLFQDQHDGGLCGTERGPPRFHLHGGPAVPGRRRGQEHGKPDGQDHLPGGSLRAAGRHQ